MYQDKPAIDELMHYGMPRRSGRHPWGSGDNPYQHSGDFLSRVDELKKSGMSESEIAKTLGVTTISYGKEVPSTTRLRALISIAKDERIHVYFNDVNKGCGYTKARCIDLANGEFCGFLDPDDLLMPEAIEKTIEILCKDSSVSLVSSKMFMADKNLKIDGESFWSCKIPDNSSFLEFGNCAITHFAAFRTDSYKKTRGLRRDALRAIDHYLYYL